MARIAGEPVHGWMLGYRQKVRVSPVVPERQMVLEVRFAIAGQACEQERRDQNPRGEIVAKPVPTQISVAGIVQDIPERALPIGDHQNGQRR